MDIHIPLNEEHSICSVCGSDNAGFQVEFPYPASRAKQVTSLKDLPARTHTNRPYLMVHLPICAECANIYQVPQSVATREKFRDVSDRIGAELIASFSSK